MEANISRELSELDSEKSFLKIAAVCMGLGLGVMLASLAALGRDATGFTFHILSPTVLMAFLIGAALGYGYWSLIGSNPRVKGASKLVRGASAFLLLLGFCGFLYPLRFIPASKLPDVLEGLVGAILALSTIGFLLLRIKKLLDADEAREG